MQPRRSRTAVVYSAMAVAVLTHAAALSTPCRAQTTLFIVRHAEKGGLPVNNPHLTDAGKERANHLAQILRSAPLTAVLTSEFERTRETVQPTAEMKDIKITRYRARNIGGLAEQILTKYKGGTLLVAGHSDTIPALLRELGVDKAKVPKIAYEEYDNLFIVFIGQAGDVTLQGLRFGTPSPEHAPADPAPDASEDSPGK